MEVENEREYRIGGLYDLDGDLAKGVIKLNPKSDMIPQDPKFEGRPGRRGIRGLHRKCKFPPLPTRRALD
jgi:hypothetical protein